MGPTKREFELVYSQEEMESRIEKLKMLGYDESAIHVLARDKDVFGNITSGTSLHTHEAESVGTQFKSFFTGEDAVRTELKKLELDHTAAEKYQEDIKNGAILLYTDSGENNRGKENISSFGDDSRDLDADEVKKNTAFTPFGRDIERDGRKHDDENIIDEDVKSPLNEADETYTSDVNSSINEADEIYTRDVPREQQHGNPGYMDKAKDSRLDGAQIHPTKDNGEKNKREEKLNREEGVNRRQDEPSPGVDPNLGPAPFGRNSEEEHLIEEERNDDSHDDPRDDTTPPTPRFF